MVVATRRVLSSFFSSFLQRALPLSDAPSDFCLFMINSMFYGRDRAIRWAQKDSAWRAFTRDVIFTSRTRGFVYLLEIRGKWHVLSAAFNVQVSVGLGEGVFSSGDDTEACLSNNRFRR